MPCHSTILAPFAKLLSKLLKLLLKEHPYIIEGSKVLAQKLNAVHLPPITRHQNVYILTGDMVAYYPNVPVTHAKEIVSGMWHEFTCAQSLDLVPQVWHDMFDHLLDLATEMLVVCQFLDSYYQQIHGLA